VAVTSTWVFNNTRDSVFIAILLHGTMDVFPNAFLLAHIPGAAEMTSAGVLLMYWGLAFGSACSRCARHLHARPAGEAARIRVKGWRTRLLCMIRSRMPWTSAGAAP
jgi:hypothetical protein